VKVKPSKKLLLPQSWKQQVASLRRRLHLSPHRLVSQPGLRDFLRLKLRRLEHEIFALVLLDADDEMIDYIEIFRGTIDGASIYPREVVKEAMRGGVAAVILVHNHPSGTSEPSKRVGSSLDG
jgi:DNA repair protein RadC